MGARDLPHGYLPDTVNPARGDTAVYEREGSIMIAVPTENGVTETPVLDIARIRIVEQHHHIDIAPVRLLAAGTASLQADEPNAPAKVFKKERGKALHPLPHLLMHITP